MMDVNQILLDMIKKCGSIETSSVNEIEELIDTGLEKNEENIQKAAMEYLEEKGYAFREDNLVRAKKHIEESSQYSDTVMVRKKHAMEEDLLSDVEDADVEKLTQACILDNLIKLNDKLDKMVNPHYQYAVEVLDDVLTDKDKPMASLQQFESFQQLLNRYADAGWHVISVTARETQNGRKLSMTGFSNTTKQVVVVFEHKS